MWSVIKGMAKIYPELETEPLLTEKDGVFRYSAFTVAELGEMLPKGYFAYKASNLPHYQCAKYTADGHVDRTPFYCN